MDSRTLSEATGVQAGTINAWAQRGYVPGVDVAVRGRSRDFDIKAATHIAIMAELMRFGFGAPFAAFIARSAVAYPPLGKPGCCLITHPVAYLNREGPIEPAGKIVGETIQVGETVPHWVPLYGFTPTYFDSEEKLPEALAQLRKRTPDGTLPGVYAVVNVARIEARIRRTEEEWSKRREARTQKAGQARSND